MPQSEVMVYVWRTNALPMTPERTWKASLCQEHAAVVLRDSAKTLAVFVPDSQSYETECVFDTIKRLNGEVRKPNIGESLADVIGQKSVLWERYYFNVIPREARVHAAQEAH